MSVFGRIRTQLTHVIRVKCWVRDNGYYSIFKVRCVMTIDIIGSVSDCVFLLLMGALSLALFVVVITIGVIIIKDYQRGR